MRRILGFSMLILACFVTFVSSSSRELDASSTLGSVALFQSSSQFVVKIETVDQRDSRKSSIGSGVWIQPNLILTNRHVVERLADAHFIKEYVYSHSSRKPIESVVAFDPRCDLALVKLNGENAAFPKTAVPDVGEKVVIWGAPTEELASTLAVVTKQIRVQEISDPTPFETADCLMINLSSTIYAGMSGGPVFNIHGELVGLATSSFDRVFGSGYAVSGSEIRRFLKEARAL